jgi:hypothetical protein
MIDLIFARVGSAITDDVSAWARCSRSRRYPCSSWRSSYGPVLQFARTLREQVDRQSVRSRTRGSGYAAAFFTLAESHGIVEPVAGAR